MELQALIHTAPLQLSDPKLCNRCGCRVAAALQHPLDAIIQEDPADCRLRFQVGEFELCVLEIEDSATKGFALTGVGHGLVERLLDHQHRLNRDDHPLARQLAH